MPAASPILMAGTMWNRMQRVATALELWDVTASASKPFKMSCSRELFSGPGFYTTSGTTNGLRYVPLSIAFAWLSLVN
jgi:hypothetical protein